MTAAPEVLALASGKKRSGRLLGNHQRCWLWGRHLVAETLAAARWPIHEIHLADRLDAERISTVQELAGSRDVPVYVEPSKRLTQLAGTKEHQGFLAKMGPFPYADVADVLRPAAERPLYLILDSLHDSYNVGAVVRSAEVFGAAAVVLGAWGQADVNSQVARSSVGAVNRVPLARAEDLADFIRTLQTRGIKVYGASEKGEQAPFALDLSGAVGLVIGNEGSGLTPPVLAACDGLVQIPQQGEIGSLNAAVAAGILLYEARRQRTD